MVPKTEESVLEALLGAKRALTISELVAAMYPEDTPKKLLKWLETGVKEDIYELMKSGWVQCVSQGTYPKYLAVPQK